MRNTLVILLLAFASTSAAVAAERVDARTWRRVKTYDMQTLQKVDPLPRGRIVGVRFNYRHRAIQHLKPNWYYGSIWSFRAQNGRANFDHIPIMVAANAVENFRAITSDSRAGRKYTVYGQILKDSEAHFLFLRLLGTKVRRDARGNAIVSW
ncbi:MAG TPA: hypothetical protein VF551_01615 [Chthoniobacterales bacterium]